MFVLLLSLFVLCTFAQDDFVDLGTLTGSVYGIEAQSVRILNNRQIQLVGFNYDKADAPLTWFFGFTEELDGFQIQDESMNWSDIRDYDREDITLTLPLGREVSDMDSFGIFCYEVKAIFASIDIPDNLMVTEVPGVSLVPPPGNGVDIIELDGFVGNTYEIRAKSVQVINGRIIRLINFNYASGGAPAVWFYGFIEAGEYNGVQIPDETGSVQNLRSYRSRTIDLEIPLGYTFDDFVEFGIICYEFRATFASMPLPALTPAPADRVVSPPGDGMSVVNLGVMQGDVYGIRTTAVHLVNNRQIVLKDFNYDKSDAPLTWFFAFTSELDGFQIPNELGGWSDLRDYDNEDVVLDLPEGLDIRDVNSIGVFCYEVKAIFAQIDVPVDLNLREIPGQQLITPPGNSRDVIILPGFTGDQYSIMGKSVQILNSRQIRIINFNYVKGDAPDVHFYGFYTDPPSIGENGVVIADELGGMQPIRSYRSETVTLTLPSGVTTDQLSGVGVVCLQVIVIFAHAPIPTVLPLEVDIAVESLTDLDNCQTLMEGQLNLYWTVNRDEETVTFAMQGVVTDGDWIAFGPSREQPTASMIGVDATVASAYLGMTVEDYLFTGRAQCSGTEGVCPDSLLGGGDDNFDVEATFAANILTARYTRPWTTGDDNDNDLTVDTPQTFVFGSGPYQVNNGRPLQHIITPPTNFMLTLGRMPSKSCTLLDPSIIDAGNAWDEQVIRDATVFDVTIGPSAAPKGYPGITGLPSWGISYYINGVIIPHITVFRGTEYTFNVRGGNDPSINAQYHPMYITTDMVGGFNQKSDEEKATAFADIQAGVDEDGSPLAAGSYCHWDTTFTEAPDTWEEYKTSLTLNCVGEDVDVLTWTPTADTPDLVYYQCWAHNSLGWKITVVDEGTVLGPTDLEGAGFTLSQEMECGITVYWIPVEEGATEVRMAARAESSGYVAVGFTDGTLTMPGSDAVIGWFDNGIDVRSYSLTSRSSSGVVEHPNLPITDVSADETDGITTIFFTRPLAAGSNPILATLDTTLIGSVLDRDEISQHSCNTRQAYTVNLGSGESSTVAGDGLEDVHGGLMIVGWGFVLVWGVLAARYTRPLLGKTLWFQLHQAFQTIGLLSVTAGFAIALSMGGGAHFHTQYHAQLGVTIMSLTYFHVIVALLRPKGPKDGDDESVQHKAFGIIHRIVGVILLILAAVNIFAGISLRWENWVNIVYGVLLGVMVVIALGLEILKQMSGDADDV